MKQNNKEINISKDEKNILNIIRYMPIISIIIISIFITQIILYKKNQNFKTQIKLIESQYIEDNKNRVKEEIERIYEQIKSEKKENINLLTNNSLKNLKEHLLKKIRNIRFGKTGYVFVYDLDGTCLAHFRNEFIGINRLDVKDKNGNFVVKDVLDFAKKNKQGFMTYIAIMKPNYKIKSRKKISYVKLFSDWNWVIGTGFYLDTLDEQINKEQELLKKSNNDSIKDILVISFILTFFTMIISFYFSRYVRIKFLNYKHDINNQTKKLKDYINISSDFIWEIDKDLKYTFVSNNVQNLLGYKSHEMIGKTPFDFMIEEDGKKIHEKAKEIVNKREAFINLKNWNIHKNGKKVLFLTNGITIYKNEEFVGYRGTDKNITEMYQKEENYKTLLEFASDGIHILDKKGNLIQCNRAFADSLGYSIDEVLKLNVKDWDSGFSEDNLLDMVNQSNPKMFETKHKRKDGTTFDVQINAKGIELDNKMYLYASQRDISEKKEQEKMLLQQGRSSAIGEMIGNIAHQWRQPLSIISTASTGLKLLLENDNISQKEVLKTLDSINDHTQHLSKTIDDFRSLFKGDVTTTSDFNITKTFEKLKDLTKDTFKNNFIEYVEDIEDCFIFSNENMFIQSLINIYNNGSDALKEQKSLINRYFFIKVKKENNKTIIELRDNAGGIPENIIEQIFDPYFTTKHSSIGTGLGLHMTYKIITEQLKGTITVKNVEFEYNNENHKGALFTIIL